MNWSSLIEIMSGTCSAVRGVTVDSENFPFAAGKYALGGKDNTEFTYHHLNHLNGCILDNTTEKSGRLGLTA